MAAVLALVAFVVGAVLSYQNTEHASVLLYVGLALLAVHALVPYQPWRHNGGI